MHTAGHMQEESYMKHLSKLGPGIKFFYEAPLLQMGGK